MHHLETARKVDYRESNFKSIKTFLIIPHPELHLGIKSTERYKRTTPECILALEGLSMEKNYQFSCLRYYPLLLSAGGMGVQ